MPGVQDPVMLGEPTIAPLPPEDPLEGVRLCPGTRDKGVVGRPALVGVGGSGDVGEEGKGPPPEGAPVGVWKV